VEIGEVIDGGEVSISEEGVWLLILLMIIDDDY